MDRIDKFTGKYAFLSNFYMAPVEYGGIVYTNNEAAFQAQKCVNPEDRKTFANLKPSVAKSKGRRVILRPDWEDIKDGIMKQICLAKFEQNPELAKKLLETDTADLIEGNDWGDKYWGVCNGEGENKLGKILQSVRFSLFLDTL